MNFPLRPFLVNFILLFFHASLVSLIEMPAMPTSQLAQMIPIEARKYIPVPITEITLDWWIIPKAQSRNSVAGGGTLTDAVGLPSTEKIDVLVVAIHNEAIAKYQEIVRKKR
jgi:Tfp pilus assembly PilM family ATPase